VPNRIRNLGYRVEISVDEAAEVTGWPINEIADAVQPDQERPTSG
jgi:hypothetical protein